MSTRVYRVLVVRARSHEYGLHHMYVGGFFTGNRPPVFPPRRFTTPPMYHERGLNSPEGWNPFYMIHFMTLVVLTIPVPPGPCICIREKQLIFSYPRVWNYFFRKIEFFSYPKGTFSYPRKLFHTLKKIKLFSYPYTKVSYLVKIFFIPSKTNFIP